MTFQRFSIRELAEGYRQKRWSPVDVVQDVLQRIETYEEDIGAWNYVCKEEAIAQARVAERVLSAGENPDLLCGIPIAVKDMIDVVGVPTTAGSPLLKNNVAKSDSTVVARLRGQGAVIIGKTNTDEFAFGATNENPFFGTVHNPWDHGRVSGGSSGGSAAALAAGLCAGALGTDTGGSIRVPAACCGVVGFKPGYGRVSRAGVIPLSYSFDTIGPLARCVDDVALLFDALAGPDPLDPTVVEDVDRPLPRREDLSGLRIGVPEHVVFDRVLDANVETVFRQALQLLEELGATIETVSIPLWEQAIAVALTIVLAEAAVYHEPWLQQHAHQYSEEVRYSLEAGRFIPASYYLNAQQARTLMQQQLHELMEDVPLIATPTIPIPAPPIGSGSVVVDNDGQPVFGALAKFTEYGSVVGLPTISLPSGFTPAGLPVGLQLMSPLYTERALLAVAALFEEAAALPNLVPRFL